MVRVKWCYLTLIFGWRISQSLLFRKPSQKSRGHQCTHQVPQLFCILSLVHSQDSKLYILKDPAPPRSASFSEVGPPDHAVSSVLCPKKTVHTCVVHGICHSIAKSSNQVIYPLCASVSCQGKGHLLVSAGIFVLEEAIYPLPKVLQEGECSLPVQPRRSLHHYVDFVASAPLLPRNACHSSSLTKVMHFQNLRI